MIIGSHNVFEVDCTVEALKIGNNNVFESKCFVGNKVTVTDGCTIGAGCKITEEQILKENTVIYGAKCNMREAIDKPAVSISLFSCKLITVIIDVSLLICVSESKLTNGYTYKNAAKLSSHQKTKQEELILNIACKVYFFL